MENGFIYPLTKWIVDNLNWFSLVEYFKKAVQLLNKNPTLTSKRAYSNIAIDIFRVFKWLFILAIWLIGSNNALIVILVWYFIATNLHTYFYYHAWCDEALETPQQGRNNHHRVRRRFINLLLAVLYSDFCFAYLYRIPYATDFSWGGAPNSLHAFWYSISNSLAANYNVVSPLTDHGNSVSMIQLLMTFIFVTIILSRTSSEVTS